MNPDVLLQVGAIFSVGAHVGALLGLAAGLTVGWGAGRYARARSRRQRRHSSGQVIVTNAPQIQAQTEIPKAPPR